MAYRIESSSLEKSPPPVAPPQPRGPRLSLAVALVGTLALVALSAGLGAAGGYMVARRELAPTAGVAPIPQSMSVKTDSAIVSAVARVKPAVVTVVNTLQPQAAAAPGFIPFGFGNMLRQPEQRASGSGVIIDSQGHIVTNFHVVDKASKLEIVFADGTKAAAAATLVGADPYNDLAVLRIDGPVPAYAELGDSAALQPGEPVAAIGSPLGEFRGSVTVGVVSALNRKLDVSRTQSLEGLIQTDAAINHGNSGGPLVNVAGQVVGINTAILRADPTSSLYGTTASDLTEGLGFAIPSARVRDIANQLITKGRVEYPTLGVRYQEITPALAAVYNLPVSHGLYVQDVESSSPAAKGGIQRGDIVTQIDGVPLDEDHSLINVLMRHKIDDVVTVTIFRNGQRQDVSVTLTGR